jgi:hypothetical protein
MMVSLDAEFCFDFDPCPHPRPDGFDGLLMNWGKRNWVNPPFMGGLLKWARKAVAEQKAGNLCVCLFPLWQPRPIMLLGDHGAEMRYAGRVRFLALEDGTPNPAQEICGYMLAILRPNAKLTDAGGEERKESRHKGNSARQ